MPGGSRLHSPRHQVAFGRLLATLETTIGGAAAQANWLPMNKVNCGMVAVET